MVRTTTYLGIGIESAKPNLAFLKKHNAKLLLCFPLGLIHLEMGVGEMVQGSLDGLARLSLFVTPLDLFYFLIC